MTDETWHCICGKICPCGETCSPKCAYIQSKMDTPLALKMDNVKRVIRFFGKQWDKKHGGHKE